VDKPQPNRKKTNFATAKLRKNGNNIRQI
jgi:hypothetical protein